VPRVVAIGDVHGSHDVLLTLLNGLGLVGPDLSWTGGPTHLVLVGDLLDRGNAERQVMDAIRALLPEAALAGGMLHVLLGNHEVMNLVRDLRYVSDEGYSSFAGLESPDEREDAFRQYLDGMRGSGMTDDALRQGFDKAYPPGYFGRIKTLGPGGEYAAWLMAQSVVIKINGAIFVHGGLTEDVASQGPDKIRQQIINDIRSFWASRKVLEDYGEIGKSASFHEVLETARSITSHQGLQRVPTIREAASRLAGFLDSPAVVANGPLWYRGNSLENERVERTRIEDVLSILDADLLVVGHTMTRTGRISSRFDRRMVKLDIGLYEDAGPQALVLEGDRLRVFDASIGRFVSPTPDPPQGAAANTVYAILPDAYLENYLETAKVKSFRPLGRGSTRPQLLEFDDDGERMRGLFKYVDEVHERPGSGNRAQCMISDRYKHEIAAYRLDRILGLRLVPVTVSRSFGSRGKGSVQRWIDAAVDHSAARGRILTDKYKKRIAGQWNRMLVFDALIGNAGRKDTDILHLTQQGRIFLVDHSKAFSTTAELEPFLDEVPCRLEPELERAMRSLNFKDLRRQLGRYLSRKQITSLLERRDLLLERCE